LKSRTLPCLGVDHHYTTPQDKLMADLLSKFRDYVAPVSVSSALGA